jgi:hypothetical protein
MTCRGAGVACTAYFLIAFSKTLVYNDVFDIVWRQTSSVNRK